MILSPIYDRIENLCTSLNTFRIAYGMATVNESQTPVAYLHPTMEEATRSTADNFVIQTLECKFSIMLAVSVSNIDTLETIRTEIRNTLLGFVPADDYDAIEYDSGEILESSASVIWWRDTFITTHYVRQQ